MFLAERRSVCRAIDYVAGGFHILVAHIIRSPCAVGQQLDPVGQLWGSGWTGEDP